MSLAPRSVATFVSSVAGATLLLALDRGVLAGPERWSVSGWTGLVDDRGPAAAAMTALRYGGIGGCVYLAVLAALTIACRACGLRLLERAIERVTLPVFRSLLGAAGIAVLSAAPSAAATTMTSDAPVMVIVESAGPATTSPVVTITSGAPTMRRVDIATTTTSPPVASISSTTSTSAPRSIIAPTTAQVTVDTSKVTDRERTPPTILSPWLDVDAVRPATWTIARGDHLWHVAEATVERSIGRRPTETETARYWRALIDVNRDRLVDRDQPDMVFTGQVFVLPSP
jgi:hypothetical protein